MSNGTALVFKFVLGAGLVISASAAPQTPVVIHSANQDIPHGYKTYSLFLVCNPKWLETGSNAKLAQLHDKFVAFGRAIGQENAAVWFSADVRNHGIAATNVDVERSVRFCKAWNLTPSDGPHIVILSARPTEHPLISGLAAEHAVYKLGGMSPDQLSDLLSRLTDQLLLNGGTAASSLEAHPVGAAPVTAPSVSLWVRLLSATQLTISEFGCAWNLKVDAGALSADLKPCKNQ